MLRKTLPFILAVKLELLKKRCYRMKSNFPLVGIGEPKKDDCVVGIKGGWW